MGNEIKNKINRNNKDLTISHVSISLGIIMIIGFVIRFHYLQDEIPLIADGLDYFTYAYKMAEIGNFPKDWALSNNGWPAFVSIILSTINADTFLENTFIQRLTSMTFSLLTAIPIFFLCNREIKLGQISVSIRMQICGLILLIKDLMINAESKGKKQ